MPEKTSKTKHESRSRSAAPVPGSTMKHPSLFGGCMPKLGRMLLLTKDRPKQRPANIDDNNKEVLQSPPSSASEDEQQPVFRDRAATVNNKESSMISDVTIHNNGCNSVPSTAKLLLDRNCSTASSNSSNFIGVPTLLEGIGEMLKEPPSAAIRNITERCALGLGIDMVADSSKSNLSPSPIRRFNTNSSADNRNYFRRGADRDTPSNSHDDILLRRFLSTHQAGRIRRSISSDPVYRTNAFARMKMAAYERGENLADVDEATQHMANSSMAFHQVARQLAEREKNKRWYQW